MAFRKQISKGIEFLLTHRNPNGGIPAVNLGDASGIWTTAEAIETLLNCPFLPKEALPQIKEMTEYLINNQVPGKGWSVSGKGKDISTMATGHSIVALSLSKKIFSSDRELNERIEKALNESCTWLHKNINLQEGGWGLEPSKASGQEVRIISTCYALKGYYAHNQNYHNSNDVKKVVNDLVNRVNKDGGWGRKKGASSDSCNTARVISILLQSGNHTKDDLIIINAISFILHSKDLWRFDIESYVSADSPGQVYFHSNTYFDVLEALIRYGYFGKEVHELINFFLDAQDDSSGHWHLFDHDEKDTSIATWTTTEAIASLSMVQDEYFENIFHQYKNRLPKIWKYLLILFGSLSLLELLYIFNVYIMIYFWWAQLSEGWQQTIFSIIVSTFIFGIIAGYFRDLIAARIKNWSHNLKNRHNRIKR